MRIHRKFLILLWSLYTRLAGIILHIHHKCRAVCKRAVIRKDNFLIIQPFPLTGDTVELPGR